MSRQPGSYHVEDWTGNGMVYERGHHQQELATVRYGLSVREHTMETYDEADIHIGEGERTGGGWLRVLGGSLPFGGGALTLRLEDGRLMPIIASGDGPDYDVQIAGDFIAE